MKNHRISKILAIVSIGLSLLVAAGWVFDLPAIKSIPPHMVTMKFNTALCLFLLSLVVLRSANLNGHRRFNFVVSSIVLLIAALTLVEYINGSNFGIDELLFRDNTVYVTPPGRMSAITAIVFSLTVIGLMVRQFRFRSAALWQSLFLFNIFFSSTAFYGYVFRASKVAPIYSYTSIAIDTIFGLIAINVAALFLSTESGAMAVLTSKFNGGKMGRKLLPLSVLALATLGYLARLGTDLGFYDSSYDAVFIVSFGTAVLTWLIVRQAEALNAVDEESQVLSERIIQLRSERRYRQVVELAADGILETDAEGRYTDVNRALCEMLGYTKEEIVGKKAFDFILEAERPRLRKIFGATGMSQDTLITEWNMIRKDGSTIPVEINSRAVPDEKKRLAIVRDVTQRKRHEEQQTFLAETATAVEETMDLQERLDLIAKSIVPRLADMCVLGLLENESLVFKTAAINDPSKLELLKKLSVEAFKTNIIFDFKGMLEDKKPIYFESVTEDLLIGQNIEKGRRERFKFFGIKSYVAVPLVVRGKSIGVLTLATTDSDRKFSKEDAAFSQTIALRLAVAVDNAVNYEQTRKAVKTREDVVAIVSHDLKNPLAAIQLGTELMKRIVSVEPESKCRDTVMERTDAIERSTKQALGLINDILDVTKLESQKGLPIQKTPVDCGKLIRNSAEIAKPIAEAKKIALTVELDGDGRVMADFRRLSQIFSNLLGNALKYTPAGGRITIGAKYHPDHVLFFVSDTGPGIPLENQKHLFDRFWQADTSSRDHSVGLGLAIAKGIAESHGGSIWVESEPGHGSRFCFKIPSVQPFGAENSPSNSSRVPSQERLG